MFSLSYLILLLKVTMPCIHLVMIIHQLWINSVFRSTSRTGYCKVSFMHLKLRKTFSQYLLDKFRLIDIPCDLRNPRTYTEETYRSNVTCNATKTLIIWDKTSFPWLKKNPCSKKKKILKIHTKALQKSMVYMRIFNEDTLVRATSWKNRLM